MKNHIDKMAKYAALILISSMPFSIEVFAESEKKLSAISVATAEKDNLSIKRKVPNKIEQ